MKHKALKGLLIKNYSETAIKLALCWMYSKTVKLLILSFLYVSNFEHYTISFFKQIFKTQFELKIVLYIRVDLFYEYMLEDVVET
jgi:hypothetical protein